MSEHVEPPFDRPDKDFNTLVGWTWVGTYGGYYLQCDQLSAFEHGFFTRLWHGREPGGLVGYVSSGVSVHRLKQVHSGRVLAASAAHNDPWPEADGLVSDAGGQSLWVAGADCTPVLIADPESGSVAAGILTTSISQLEASGCRREQLLVALGPAVSGPNYQVERSTSEQLGPIDDLQAAGALLDDPQEGRDRLDIRRAAHWQLLQFGLRTEQISICPLCTVAEPELFHSWRRDQVKAVQWSGIVSQNADTPR